jgi:hypothetical protein
MNLEQQRIKIAEACGWKRVTDGHYESWVSPEGYEYQVMFGWQTYKDGTDILPDYLNDLNAMHEAEKTLDDDLDLDYSENIEIATGARWGANNSYDMSKYRSATAAQRAEAFLRALNLWEE